MYEKGIIRTMTSYIRTFKYALVIVGVLLAYAPHLSHAATFAIALDKDTFALGSEFTANIKMDTENVGVNASQGTISFSPDVLSVSSIDRTSSVFNFWLQEPTFANDTGKITFLGGSTNGFTGSSLEVFKITFKVKGVGKSDITFTDGAITASDGSGTNVMRATQGVNITSVSKGTVSVIQPPAQISRTPTAASGLPTKPILTIPLYPDPQKWYNLSSSFNVRWTLPNDVSDVATAIDKDPRSSPIRSEGLFDNKTFPALLDGVWYLHIRFKNNIGWGPVATYRLAVDTTPPLPFSIKEDFGAANDNPSPILTYTSGDKLSGVTYHLLIDNNEIVVTTSTSYTLPPQTPGTRHVRVRAYDLAGNITDSAVDLTIIPIATPTMTLTSRDIYVHETKLGVNGTALPNAKVRVTLANGDTSFQESTDADANGLWSAVFDQVLAKGTYEARAIAVDARGAESLPAILSTIAVKERPVFSLVGIDVTPTGLIWILLALLFGGFGGGYWLNYNMNRQRGHRALIATRDVANVFRSTKNDLTKTLAAFSSRTLTSEEIANITFLLKRTIENIEKTERYITNNISEIGK